MTPKYGFTLLFLFIVPFIESGYVREIKEKRLNEYISHYERLSYDQSQVHASHTRAKRSVTADHHVHLKFDAHGRKFHIRLKRDLTTFSDNLMIVDGADGRPITVDTSHIYNGEVLGDRNSYVFGSISDGVFEGKIITDRDAFYVEKAKHYFPNRTQYLDEGFHSVIYNEENVNDPYAHKRHGHVSGCGITEEVSQWMDRVQNSANDEDEAAAPPPPPSPLSKPQPNAGAVKIKMQANKRPNGIYTDDDDFRYPHEKYSREANWQDAASDDHWNHAESHERVRRATRPKEENKNTCSLYIQTDPLIWRHIREGIADIRNAKHDRNQKNEIDEKTREEILSLIAHHVTAVNYIYRNTKFDGRVEHRNIRFEVQRIKIDDDSACGSTNKAGQMTFCNENIDVSNFLNIHSLGNHEVFCLAYVFTYRDFTGGTLGLAWVASASGASGGICEKFKTYTETVGGLYQSTKRSLNTGIITFVNYNSRVPPKVSQLTLAHEIGHNFGSPHDYPQECRPGGIHGNYIMFASATSGDRPNNSKFSTCSVRNISNVLDAIEDNKKRNCFQASEGAFCGNKIVEVGEECDCGFSGDECHDSCCYPRQITEYDQSQNATAKGCTRRANTQCSPSQGPCCVSSSCQFVSARERLKCREETECSWSATCNGTTPECPDSKPRDDKTKCNNGTQLCISGDCAGSICLLWNMTECFLTSHIIPNIDKRKLCELACQNGNDTSTCRSTSEFASLYDLPLGGISLRSGSPCDNFQGYCDVLLKCRAVDAEGPLVRLKNLLFNKETLLTVAQWVTENWYAVVFMGIGFIIFMGIFIKCCAVHTPSSNPKKPPARRISETLRRPMNTLRRMRHNHGGGGGGGGGPGPRSIPPPHGERSGRQSGGGGGGHSSGNNAGSGQHRGASHEHPRSAGDGGRGGSSSAGGGGGGSGGGPAGGSRRPRPGGGPGAARGPSHGYGEGRGQQYYPPKAPAPLPAHNYSRPPQQQQQYQQHQPQQQQLPLQHHHQHQQLQLQLQQHQQLHPHQPHLELYADAYPVQDRHAYELPLRHPHNKV